MNKALFWKVLIISGIGCAVLIWFSMKAEVPAGDYAQLATWGILHPEIKPLVTEFMQDNKIDHFEYIKVSEKVDEIATKRNKELVERITNQ